MQDPTPDFFRENFDLSNAMAEKGVFVKFMGALKKHFRAHYPFMKQLEKSLDASIPKSACFYLGVSPKYEKHVIIVHAPV